MDIPDLGLDSLPDDGEKPGYLHQLKSNQFFAAGFGLGALGAASTILKKLSVIGISIARRKLLVSVELNSRDPSYVWFLNWMARNVKHTQHLSVSTDLVKHDNGTVTTSFGFLPSTGRHYFRYKRTFMSCERVRETNTLARSGQLWESIVITMLGYNKHKLLDLMEEAKFEAIQSIEGRTIVYSAMGHEWRQFGNPLRQRPVSSIYLPSQVRSRVLNDIEEFLSSQDWYVDHGVPYRRGYLFYGEPGSGKTSFIHALAGAIGYNICVVNLSEKTWTDDRLQYLFANCPDRSILLLEDVDAAFIDRQAEIPRGYTRADAHLLLSYSGLLNALDGVMSSDAQLVFMTTNHKQLLDPALIRPGRVDLQEYFGNAVSEQVVLMLKHFFPDVTEETCSLFSSFVPDDSMSMAELQGMFLLHKDDLDSLIDSVRDLNLDKVDDSNNDLNPDKVDDSDNNNNDR